MTGHRMDSPPGPEVILDGKQVLYFAGTSYFSLHSHPEMLQAASTATLNYGIGSATSRSMTGTTTLIDRLEETIARFFGSEDAVYLPSGYLSSLAGIRAMEELNLFDRIYMDEHSHYCNLEAARAIGKPITLFKHRDPEDLASSLSGKSAAGARPLIISDGLFPATGQLAPVGEYVELAEKYRGAVWIDDAHGTAILGETGKGTCEHLGVASPLLYTGTTLSKAFGAYGGAVAGTSAFTGQIRQGNVMTGSNSPMNAAVAASLKGIELVESHPRWREELWKNARYLRRRLKESNSYLPVADVEEKIPVIACTTGDSRTMNSVQQRMLEKGIYLQHTTYPGSGKEGMLRMVVTSAHTFQQIDRLAEEIGRLAEELTKSVR